MSFFDEKRWSVDLNLGLNKLTRTFIKTKRDTGVKFGNVGVNFGAGLGGSNFSFGFDSGGRHRAQQNCVGS